MATTQSGSFNTNNASAVGSAYPKYAKVSYNAVFNEDTLKWDVTWSATAQGGSTATKYVTVFSGSVTIKKSSTTISTKSMSSQIQKATNDTTLLSGSFSVAPNETGDLTISIAATFQFYTTGSGGTAAKTQSITLPVVAISSTITLTNPSITVSALSGTIPYTITSKDNYYHNLYYGASRSTAIQILTAYNINNTNYSGSVSINSALLSMVPTASGPVYFYLDTFRDSACTDQLGSTVMTTLNVSVDISVFKPTLTLTNITTDSSPISGYLVAGHSSGKCPGVTSNPGTGSAIARIDYNVSFGSSDPISYTTTGRDLTFPVCPASENDYQVTLTATAYDQRGAASASATKTATVYGYAYPVITANIYRVDNIGDTTEGSSGEYVRINFSATQAKTVNGQNTIKSGSPYCEASGGITGNQSNNTYPVLSGNSSATFRVICEDQVASATLIATVNRARWPLSLYDDLQGDMRVIVDGRLDLKGDTGHIFAKNDNNIWTFDQHNGSYKESFKLPQTGSLSADAIYEILTSKYGGYTSYTQSEVFSSVTTGKFNHCMIYRIGPIAVIRFGFTNTGTTAGGADRFVGTLKSEFIPYASAKGGTFYSNSVIFCNWSTNGSCTARVVGSSTVAANYDLEVTLVTLMP